MNADNRILPHNTDIERVVLSTIKHRKDMLEKYGDIISEGLFYASREKAIYNAISSIVAEGKNPTSETIMQHAATHDLGYRLLVTDIDSLRVATDLTTFLQHINLLRTMEMRRKVWLIHQSAATAAIDQSEPLDGSVSQSIQDLCDLQRDLADRGPATFREAVRELTGIVNDNHEGKTRSIVTGFRLFDQMFLLRPGTLTIIAAFTSVGKSALAMNIAYNVATRNTPVAYYSLEMGKAELAARVISPLIGIPSGIIANQALSDDGFRRYHDMTPSVENLQIYIDERSTVSFDATVTSIRMLAKTKGVRLVIIDYLQIYTQTNDNVEASLGQMARQAKNVAVETGASVILLSQLNRSSDTPSLKMLRGSGQIEESADNVVLIDRPDAYPDSPGKFKAGKFKNLPSEGKASLILAKGRGVGTGERLMSFDPKTTIFKDIDTQEDLDGQQEEAEEVLPF